MAMMEREHSGWYLATRDVWNYIWEDSSLVKWFTDAMEDTYDCVCTTEQYCVDQLGGFINASIWHRLGTETPSLYGMDNVRWDNLAEWFIAYRTGRWPREWSMDT